MNEYSQVHQLPKGYIETDYTYDGVLPWTDIGRIAIYLVSFGMFFVIMSHIFRALI